MSKQKRTKGNKHPSTSANAFNLFLKYNNTNETPNFDLSNYSSLTDESNHEIFIAIKKCYKKDLITRQKGLKDILELFINNQEEHSFLLKQWIKVFLVLSNDNDFQIREITLTTFKQINKLLSNKSLLQPYLKQIVPQWLCLCGDPNTNVSKVATDSFSLFSKEKLNDVFIFCKEQILDNIDIILFQTNYNEKKNEIRLISGAFYSLIILSKISKDDQFINDELIKLLNRDGFWKYSKFNDYNIQSSWFNLINSLLLFKFDLTRNYIKKINDSTFNRLGDKNLNIQQNIFKVIFTLMKLDEDNCYKELNYDKLHKSFFDLVKRNTFDQELLINNLDLLLKYFFVKNCDNKEQFIDTLFNLYYEEILDKKDQQALAINLYFGSLLYIIQNLEFLSFDQNQLNSILERLVAEKLNSLISSLDSKFLQELFKKLVNFSSNLKELNCDQQVKLVNELIFNSVKIKLSNVDEFDFQSIKSLLNIIFNLKAFQSKRKLNFIKLNETDNVIEFVKFKFEFYEQTDDLQTKKEILNEIIRIIFDLKKIKLSINFIEFLNYLVQFTDYLNILDDDLINKFILYFKIILNDNEFNDKNLIIQLYYVIQQVILKSNSTIQITDLVNLDKSNHVLSFIFTLQLFKEIDYKKFDREILEICGIIFNEFENHLINNRQIKLPFDDLIDVDDEINLNNKKIDSKLISLLDDNSELNLLNIIYSLLNLKLESSIYEQIFIKLINYNQEHDKIHILVYLILDNLKRNQLILPIKTIEYLIFNFIEFTIKNLIETKDLWIDVLFKSLELESDQQSTIINDLLIKFRKMYLEQRLINFDQLNLLISNIYAFVLKLKETDKLLNNFKENLIENLLINSDEFEKLKTELNDKVFEFLYIKNVFTEYDFTITNNQSNKLKLPHLVHVSYACLKISKLFNLKSDESLSLEDFLDESTDQKLIVKLLEKDNDLEYILNNSILSYSYLKILNQIYSYGMTFIDHSDLVENYINYYENHLFNSMNNEFIKKYANQIYEYNHDNYWSILSIHHLLKASSSDSDIFDFQTISKTLKSNNFSLIMNSIPKNSIELFLEQIIQFNLISKIDYPNNFNDIKEYLNIISICLKNYLVIIDYDVNLFPIVNCLMCLHDKILAKELNQNELYLKESDLDNKELVNSITTIINFLEEFIKRSADDLNAKFTNLLFYSLLKWTEILNTDFSKLINNIYLCNYLNRLFSLINHVLFLMQLNTPSLRKARNNWLENYSAKINERLFKFFIRLSRHEEIEFVNYDLINTLSKCLVEIDNNSLIKVQLKEFDLIDDQFSKLKITTDDDNSLDLRMSKNLNKIFIILSTLLMKKSSLFSITSHQLIKKYLDLFADNLNHDLEFVNSLEHQLFLKPPSFLFNLMNLINEELESDTCFNEKTNSSKIIYFFIWDEILEFWSKLIDKIKNPISNYLKHEEWLDDLFSHFNNILPIDKQLLAVYYKHGLTKELIKEYFQNNLQLESSNLWSASTLYHLGCQIYLKIFKIMPTTMRIFINTYQYQTQIKEFTSKFVSPILIENELKIIQDRASNNFDVIKFKVRPSTNEIMASYVFEDIKIELNLTLPNDYPINLIKINCGQKIGVDSAKWRSYELQLTSYLARNGSVFDGVLIWINNLKKSFDVEECMICFYVISNTNYQLPSKSCKHCRKKFHQTCLSKWFQKGSKKNCPLCRTDFNI